MKRFAGIFNQRQAEAYKGYLITPLIAGQYTVSKDKAHICYASSVDDAKRKIDEVAE